jgi:hypothetical protein
MADILTKEEKTSIIESRKKGLSRDKFNFELAIIEENAISTPNSDVLSTTNSQLADINARIAALDAELASLEE